MNITNKNLRIGNWLFRWRSYLPLLFLVILLPGFSGFSYINKSHRYDYIWEIICLSISFFGFAIRSYTIGFVPEGTSGRNEKKQKADSLNTDGIYSLMRNPLYFGNFFMYLGATMFVRLWWVSLIYILLFMLYYERIILAEEEFLKKQYGKIFDAYTDKTHAFIPSFSNWRPPKLPFSFRNILKREYPGFFGLITSFTIMEIIGDYIIFRKIIIDSLWAYFFLFGFLVYITLRTLKKKTKLLHVQGR
ncbi:MAG: isoprenylcysteine carboxylmethyltransferase family protein [Pseudomonadota bacterium]